MERPVGQVFRNAIAVTAFALFGFAAPSQAATITTLYNTGVDGSGALLSHGADDPHYSLITVPSGSTTDRVITAAGGGWPVQSGVWLTDNATSRWITPTNSSTTGTSDNDPVGNYVWQTTFDLTGFDPATAQITGQWATDNSGSNIILNGNVLNLTASGFTAWSAFSITSGFVAGVNTLSFLVTNAAGTSGNPTGLRVEMTGTASPVPLPAAAWLLLSGLVGFGALGRRRVTTNA